MSTSTDTEQYPHPDDLPDPVETWEQADRWIEFHSDPRTDHPMMAIIADALRARGAIDPQTYTAIWGNVDYTYDVTLWDGLPLTENEMAWLGEVTREHRS